MGEAAEWEELQNNSKRDVDNLIIKVDGTEEKKIMARKRKNRILRQKKYVKIIMYKSFDKKMISRISEKPH